MTLARLTEAQLKELLTRAQRNPTLDIGQLVYDAIDASEANTALEAQERAQAQQDEEDGREEGFYAEREEYAAHGDDRSYYISEDYGHDDVFVPGLGRCNDGGEPIGFM